MEGNKHYISRRNFFKTAGAVGVGSLLSPFASLSADQAKSDLYQFPSKAVPTRPFGKTGVDVSILGLGHAFTCSSNLLLKQSLNLGVGLWDTAATYAGGNEEKGIGKYFAKFPEDRKKVFLVTKSSNMNSDHWSTDLDRSLERMNTAYIDLFLVRSVSYAKDLTPPSNDAELWAEKAKSEGKIRFFGFSTHRIIEENSMQASKFGWIDGIMFSYNFRNMRSENMNRAIDACARAGIGLIAMKTQASGWLKEKEETLFNQLAKKGLTIEQAKLKAVWDDQRIACITSAMTNMTVLLANVAAAVNNQKLSLHDKQLLDQYARQTASTYCAGCASICESEINDEVPISDVMRFLMYARCYGDRDSAKSLFRELPSKVRKRMANIDYEKAERKCPQRMEIGRLMREATTELV
jgi:predicted aldo/keto reductase-like oxidoreductase